MRDGRSATAVVIERPWMRVKAPTEIPPLVDEEVLLHLNPEEFAALLRDHLVPRQPYGPERTKWDDLWVVLTDSDLLADRTYDVLDEFLEATEAACADTSLDKSELSRARKYQRFLNDACNRLDRVDRPLAWAGTGARAFNTPSRKVIQQLVVAIADHRRQVLRHEFSRPSDRDLWRVLDAIGLDPDGSKG